MPRSVLMLALSAATLAVPAAPAAAAGLGSLYSCSAQGSANTTGAVVGGLIGALAGSQVSKDNRAVGAAVGAGIGAAIGNSVGCRMDKNTRASAQEAFERALETGKAQSWRDAQTGASGRIEVLDGGGSAPSTPAPVYSGRWRFAEGVSPAIRASSVGGSFAANNRINLRAAPNANAPIVDRLQAGETFHAAGTVAGGWLAVQADGLIQGYVSRSVVQPVRGGGQNGGCRRVRQTISEPGQSTFRETFNACRDRNGEWSLTQV